MSLTLPKIFVLGHSNACRQCRLSQPCIPNQDDLGAAPDGRNSSRVVFPGSGIRHDIQKCDVLLLTGPIRICIAACIVENLSVYESRSSPQEAVKRLEGWCELAQNWEDPAPRLNDKVQRLGVYSYKSKYDRGMSCPAFLF